MRELLVTQQYHSPDLSTQGKGLFGIQVIFLSLPPRLVKAPASRACLILNSLREWIRCPVKLASLPKCCMQIDTKGKARASGTPAMNVGSMGWQSAWLGGEQRAVVPRKHRTSWAEADALHLLQSQTCHMAPGKSLCPPLSPHDQENQSCRRLGSSPPAELLTGRCSKPAMSQRKELPKHFLGTARTARLQQPYCMKGLVRGSLRDQSLRDQSLPSLPANHCLSPLPATRDLHWKRQRCASLPLTSPKVTRRLCGSSSKTHQPALALHRKNSG